MMNTKRKVCLMALMAVLCFHASAQKNVLIIAIDDLKPLLSAYGDDLAVTPNIDRIAARGTTFLNASCQQAVCAPSRASLLTGLYPDETAVYDLKTLIRDKNPDVITLPQHFKLNGYYTLGAGKLFDPRSVDDQYDTVSWSEEYQHSVSESYYDATTGSGYKGYHNPQTPSDDAAFEQYMIDNPGANESEGVKLFPDAKPSAEGLELPDNSYKDGATAEWILQKLDQVNEASNPFFLVAGFSKPHLPFNAPKKYWDLYDINDIAIASFQEQPADVPTMVWRNNGEMTNSYSDVPYFQDRDLNDEEQKKLIHGYFACVSYIDAQIGKIIDKMDTTGLMDNTTIVLWGDHGWHLGDHNLWGKHSNLEQAVRSPLIIADPGMGAAGQSSNSPVEFVDIYPTLCDLTGLSKPDELSGKSLLPILEDASATVRYAAMGQFPRGAYMGYTLRNEQYRYTKWVQMDYDAGERYGAPGGFQLYDLDNDPNETTNLAEDVAFQAVIDSFELEFTRRSVAQSTLSGYVNIKTCESSYTVAGETYDAPGVYQQTLTAVSGEDSVVTIEIESVNAVDIDIIVSGNTLLSTMEGVAYEWINCETNEAIAGATGRNFTPEVPGSYAVKLWLDDCSYLSDCAAEGEEEILGIDSQDKLILYPMPLREGVMSVQLDRTYHQAAIQLINLSGEVLLTKEKQNINQFTLNLPVDKGLYLLQMDLDGERVVKRVVVE
ncbi:sulfatase [Marinoscillum sp. MHG1-6]|uniref:sulfatase n=1 Tax=Marinoscillum sp. MHG1-6 TaxID=2959627 RepID=UPI002157F68F|nr:sulfatase [Marinoscillum sp. MHG1-6]